MWRMRLGDPQINVSVGHAIVATALWGQLARSSVQGSRGRVRGAGQGPPLRRRHARADRWTSSASAITTLGALVVRLSQRTLV